VGKLKETLEATRPASPLPPSTEVLFDGVLKRVAAAGAVGAAARVLQLVQQAEALRRQSLNLNPSEGVMSAGARQLLASDLATRVAEGFPGSRGNAASNSLAIGSLLDELEATIVALARQLFGAQHVEWRPLSSTMANALTLFALMEPGDVLMAQSLSSGGNVSYQREAVAGLRGLDVIDIPGTRDFSIDVDAFADLVRRHRPRGVIVGGSKVLFPYPLQQIRAIADEVDAYVIFDAAHVGPFIAAGAWPDPLANGAHVVTQGTHKIMGGPNGGLVLTNSAELAARFHALAYPAFVQTRDLSKYAAAAFALAEMLSNAHAFSTEVLQNASALGSALTEEGFDVVGKERGYSLTHQLLVDTHTAAIDVVGPCQAANILVAKTNLDGEVYGSPVGSGLRLSVGQITRQGMQQPEMAEVARLIADVGFGRIGVAEGRHAVDQLVRRFPDVGFTLHLGGDGGA
jgi:glycine hydroxymethyltransferase